MPKMMLMVSLSLKGRVVKEFTFAKDSLVIGRDPEADIFLDNTGVSRRHAKIEWTSKGYFVEDLGSANGTFLNDEEIERHILDEDDVVRVGKFSLWIGLKRDGRDEDHKKDPISPAAIQGTTVLSTEQVAKMMENIKEAEQSKPELQLVENVAETPVAPSGGFQPTMMWVGMSALAGACVGSLITWFVLR
jgi:pSer/pThr/pTyr-binding forkhead associated (FHA) protein